MGVRYLASEDGLWERGVGEGFAAEDQSLGKVVGVPFQ